MPAPAFPPPQTIVRCLRGALLAGLPALVAAQVVAPGSARNTESAIVLSPFVVDTSQDTGYFASTTLAASRLKTDLKDIASSVSVLIEKFMNDLAANDVATALVFVSGAENDSTYHQESVASLGGANGYVGGDFGDNNNRSGEIRVRGLGRATTTINFIEILGSTDRYDTDRSGGRVFHHRRVGNPTSRLYVRPNNAASTENLVSKGESLEVSFRPNRNWDFIGGVDRLENVATNVGREVAEFLAVRAPFYRRYFDQGLRADGTTTTASSTRLVDTFVNTIASNYVNEILKEGISNRGISGYTARVVGRYKFTEGGCAASPWARISAGNPARSTAMPRRTRRPTSAASTTSPAESPTPPASTAAIP